jgi:DNA-directed RNA polymerase specialized sigma24 family protein
MDMVPLPEREALMLWNGGMNYQQIAERIRQSSEVVGVLLARARNRLMMAYDLSEV